MINAIVLAGDSKSGAVEEGVENKSLIMIHRKPMVEYVIDALREAKTIGSISVVGPIDLLQPLLDKKVDYYFEAKDSIFKNVKIGMTPFLNDSRILIVTSDIPMVSGEAIDDFVRKSLATRADLCYPIVSKEKNDKKYPGIKRTYVKLKGGTFTGGNAFFVNPAIVDRCEKFAEKLIEYRKKPWKMGRLLGLKFLLLFFVGFLTISKVENRFSQILNIQARAIISDYPEIGNDVDKPSDIDMVRRMII